MRTFCLAVLLALAPAFPSRAEPTPDARRLLQQVTEAYRALTSYRFEGLMSVTAGGEGPGQGLEVPVAVAADRAGRARVSVNHPQMGMLLVSDGQQTWTYLPSLNQYTRTGGGAPRDSSGLPLPPQGSPFTRYFNLTQGVRDADVRGSQTLKVGDRTSDCWVVRCDVTPPDALAADSTARAIATFWVDKARHVVLHDSTSVVMRNPATGSPIAMVQITSFTVGDLDGTLPDSLFAFAAPAGATEVQGFSMPGQQQAASELVGKPAPAFALTDTKGRRHTLAAYKGRVVVLDFWATWCKPCRIEMPRLEKLHKELKAKGLVVLGIDYAESPATVRSFLAKNPYTFPILLDTKGETAGQYRAEVIPTLVVVGKDGLVKSYFQGVRDESVLRQAVADAGVK